MESGGSKPPRPLSVLLCASVSPIFILGKHSRPLPSSRGTQGPAPPDSGRIQSQGNISCQQALWNALCCQVRVEFTC